jgi:hypothetical protein
MVAIIAVTAALTLLSAYGAICIAWDPFWLNRVYPPVHPLAGDLMYPHILDNLLLYRLSNIITWIGAFFWGYVIYAIFTQKKAAYLMALITSAVCFVMGIIPAIISDTKNFTIEFSVGSPHWARTFANGLVLIMLLIPPMKKGMDGFAASKSTMTGNIAQQLMVMSMFFFWLSLVSFLGTTFMASAHVINGVNVWQLLEIQSIGAYVTLAAGGSMLGGGFILKQFNPSKALITTVEVNNQ